MLSRDPITCFNFNKKKVTRLIPQVNNNFYGRL